VCDVCGCGIVGIDVVDDVIGTSTYGVLGVVVVDGEVRDDVCWC